MKKLQFRYFDFLVLMDALEEAIELLEEVKSRNSDNDEFFLSLQERIEKRKLLQKRISKHVQDIEQVSMSILFERKS